MLEMVAVLVMDYLDTPDPGHKLPRYSKTQKTNCIQLKR